MNYSLAWSEIYITIGRLFRCFDLQMHPDSSDVDVTEFEDYFSGFLPLNKNGLLVTATTPVEK